MEQSAQRKLTSILLKTPEAGLDFDQLVHGQLLFHPRSQYSQPEEKSSAEQKRTCRIEQNRVIRPAGVNVFKGDRKDEPRQHDAAPEEKS